MPGSAQTESDLEANVPLLRAAIATAARGHFSLDVRPSDFELRMERIDETDWRAETNLGERLGLDAQTLHSVVERGLLGVAGLNARLEAMRYHDALSGFRSQELPLMEEKLGFLARQLDPDAQRERFDRVIELLGLPDVDPSHDVHDVDMRRLLEIVGSDDVRQFRSWLRGIDSLDQDAVKDEIHRVRELVSHALKSPAGKTVRLLTTTGIGVVAPPVGAVLDAADMFLTEKIVQGDGPAAFLNRLYPSIFQS